MKKYEKEQIHRLNDGKDQMYTRHEVYQLKYWDEVSYKEYWRVDVYIDHRLGSYEKTSGHCGPYMHARKIHVDSVSPTGLYEYSPKTTAEDVGVNVQISFAVTTGGTGIYVGYGWSWNNLGVRYDAMTDYVALQMN